MALSPGARLGDYEVLEAIGAGGMGEVYRARDTRLNRDVALKVLPAGLADDDRLARFRREAQVLASLNHPNIAHLYGFVEGSAGAHALIMELVPGTTLADRIAAGPIPLAEALPIARQIADALETAHDQGIIHRDLKPANVKVRDDGTVKVLDFGLAKALTSDGSTASSDAMNSPTLTGRATQLGMILGTAAYMAPEQARGRVVDRRADIWAFGVVLYEMLAGRRAFDGEDISITLAGVLKEDVDWQALPADLPASIRRLLRRCLEKDPKRRLSAIGDARIEIDEANAPGTADVPHGATPDQDQSRARGRSRLAWILAGAAAVLWLGTLAAVWWPRDAQRPLQRIQFDVGSEGDVTSSGLSPQLSPDGQYLAFVSPPPTGGASLVWIRPLDGVEAHILAGTEGASTLFWSPDSQSLGFSAAGRILRINLSGGPPQPLCDMPNFAGAAWTATDGIIVAIGSGGGGRLFRVPEHGGPPVEVMKPAREQGQTAYLWPAVLPDGKHFLYLASTVDLSTRAVYVGSLDGGASRRLMASDSMAVYAEPGFLLFSRAGTLFAQRFDARSQTLSGDALPLAQRVLTNQVTGRAAFSVSTNGLLAYRRSTGAEGLSELAWFDRAGKLLGTAGDERNYNQIRLSPDGRRVAVSEIDTSSLNYRIGVLDLGNGVSSIIADERITANDPVWSPDNQTIAYEAIKTGRQLFTHRVGDPQGTLVFESADDPKWLDDWSADGKFLLFHLPKPSKLYAVPLDGPRTPIKLLDTTEVVDGAHFSPDGKWIAYQITESGTYQVWVASFPAFDKRQRVSPQGGGQAFWRGDGKELFYLTPTGKVMAVRVTPNAAGGTLEVAAPVELFQSPFLAPTMGLDQYAVTKDGQRFLFIRPRAATIARPPTTIVVNWAESLGRK